MENENKLSREAKDERNKYLREWRSKNKDKVKASINRHWEKKAQKTGT